jgi:hypothetical protein
MLPTIFCHITRNIKRLGKINSFTLKKGSTSDCQWSHTGQQVIIDPFFCARFSENLTGKCYDVKKLNTNKNHH